MNKNKALIIICVLLAIIAVVFIVVDVMVYHNKKGNQPLDTTNEVTKQEITVTENKISDSIAIKRCRKIESKWN